MADPYQSSANFVNPQYATPEQLKSLREYANELLTGKGQQQVHVPSQGWSNIVNALVGGYLSNRADNQQREGIGSAIQNDAALAQHPIIQQLMGNGGGGIPQGPQASVQSSPMPPAQGGGPVPSTSKVWGDQEAVDAGLYDAPSSGNVPSNVPGANILRDAMVAQKNKASVQPASGASGAPMGSANPPPGIPSAVNQGYNPAAMAAFQHNPWANPNRQAFYQGTTAPQGGTDVYGRPTIGSFAGGVNAQGTGPDVQPGIRAPVKAGGVESQGFITASNGQPKMDIPGMGGSGNGLDALAAKDRELTRLQGINLGGTGAQANVVKEDIDFANQAPQVLKTVGAITDNIQRFGDKMTFGPTAPWSQEVKKLAANYAPGVVKDQIDAIAAADGIEKLSGNLGSLLSRQMSVGTGTDAQMLQGLKTVPGLMQSKQGALAMANMIQQTAEKQQQLGRILQDEKNWANYPQIKAEFFRAHPVINPLTGNPIEMDIRKAGEGKGAASSGGWGIVR